MSFDVPIRQTAWDAVLRWALLGGGIAELIFGSLAIFAWQRLVASLQIEEASPVFVNLAGTGAIGVGLMIVVAGLAPWRYHAVITSAAVMRFLSAAVLVWLVSRGVLPRHIYYLAAADGILSVLHFLYSRRTAPAAAGQQ